MRQFLSSSPFTPKLFQWKKTLLTFLFCLPLLLCAQLPAEDVQLNQILQSLDQGESIVGKKIDLRDINFETGKSNLAMDSKGYLSKITDFLSKVPNINLNIVGHTDSEGTAADNDRLSLTRATAVLVRWPPMLRQKVAA